MEARGAVAGRWRRGRGPAAHGGGGAGGRRRTEVEGRPQHGGGGAGGGAGGGDGGQHGTARRRGGAARRDGEDGEATSSTATRRHGEEQHGEEGHGEHGQHFACVRRRQGARRRSSSICQSWATKRPSPALKQTFSTGWCHQPVPKVFFLFLSFSFPVLLKKI